MSTAIQKSTHNQSAISVLYVDDEEVLLDLAKLFLERSGEFKVDTITSARKALDTSHIRSYDAIVSDYQMPDMDGIEFLKIVRKQFGDIPFILFTGKGREEVVVKAIDNGVDSYIQKGGDTKSQFAELSHKLKKAVERSRVVRAFEKSEERMRLALEGINEGLWDINISTGQSYMSPRGCEMLGYTFDDIEKYSGRGWRGLVHPDDLPILQKALDSYLQGKSEFIQSEHRLLMKSGEWKWVLTRGKVVEYDEHELPVRFVGTNTDITKRKIIEIDLEENRRTLQTLMDNLPGMVYKCQNDSNWTMEVVSDGVFSLTGYSRDELVNNRDISYDSIIHPDDREKIWQYVQQGVTRKKPYQFTYRIICKDGTIKWVWENGRGIYQGDILLGLEGYISNITPMKNIEREIQISEKRLLLVTQNAGSWIWEVDSEGYYTYSSPAVEAILGYHPDELVKKVRYYELFDPSVRNKLRTIAIKAFDSPKPFYNFINMSRHKNGSLIILKTSGMPVFDEQGIFSGYIGVDHDITREKEAEDKLIESEEKFRTLIEQSLDGIVIVDFSGNILFVNPRFGEILRHPKVQDLVGSSSIFSFIIPEFRESALYDLDLIKSGMNNSLVNFQMSTIDKRIIWVECVGETISYAGSPSILLSIHDITERKKAEDALRESEEKLGLIFMNSPVALTLVSAIDGIIVDVNETFVINTGYSRNKVIGLTSEALGLFPDIDQYNQMITSLRDQKEIKGMEMVCRIASGEIRTCRLSSGIIMMGDRPHFLSSIEDITKQRESEIVNQAIVKSMVGTTGINSLDTITKTISSLLKADCVMIGEIQGDKKTVKSLSMILDGHNIADFSYVLAGTPCENVVRKGFCQYPDNACELFPDSPDIKNLNIRGYIGIPLRNSAGEVNGVCCVLSRKPIQPSRLIQEIMDIIAVKAAADIERFHIEQTLRENQQKLTDAMDLASLVNWEYDVINDIFTFDDRFYALYGTTIEREGGTHIHSGTYAREFVHPGDYDIVGEEIKKAIQKTDEDYVSQFEHLIIRRDGEIRKISVRIRITKDVHGRTIKIHGVNQDITEVRKTEEELRKSEEQFRALGEQSPDIIVRVNRDYQILYINPRITDYTGLAPENLIGTDSRIFIGYEDNVTSWAKAVKNVFECGKPESLEWKFDKGTWFDCLVYPEFGENNEVQVVTSSIRDITRTKLNEVERDLYYRDLLIQREFTRALLDAIPIPVYWKNTNQRYIGCNKAFAKILGIPEEELTGKLVTDIWKDKEAGDVNSRDDELITKGVLLPYQTKLTDISGTLHEVIISKNIFFDHHGNIAGIVGVLQDITDYNQLIQDLKTREELFRMIINQSSDFFLIISPRMEISYISPSVEHLSGFLTEEVIGNAEQFVHPDDFKRVASQIERLIHNPNSTEIAEFRSKKRDGSYILLEGVAINCMENPVIKGILITARDITEKRKIEHELSRNTRLFQTVLDSSPAFFAILDAEGYVLFVNHACSVYAGIPDTDLLGVPIRDIFPSDWKDECERILTDIKRTKSPSVHEFQQSAEKEKFILSAIFFPIQEEDSFLIGFIGLDITENRDLLLKLDESLVMNTVLEKMVQERTEEVSNLLDLKDSLITGIAHELRTPLTPLTALLPLLAEEENYSKRMEIIRVIQSNTSKIANIVEKILHLAQLGTIYKIEDLTEEHIFTIVENLLNAYSIAVEKKNLTIHNEVPSNLILHTSRPHFISVLDNIISNAVKYSKYGGTIQISAGKESDNICLYFRDDGIGMTKEELNRVFEPFFKAEPSRHDRSSPGLGLSVTRRFLQVIGGTISINSDGPDKGTEVILIFRNPHEGIITLGAQL